MPDTARIVADIHLSDGAPERARRFFAFLQTLRGSSDPLFILGDLFDVWCGDDEDGETADGARDALRRLTAGGAPVFVGRGNRDFLLGARFARQTGCALLPDEYRLRWKGGDYLLTHGDNLVDDPDYYRHRRWRRALYTALAALLPLGRRRVVARRLRARSRGGRRVYAIDSARCARVLRRHNCRCLIHGHTHQPGKVEWESYTRYALPDWISGGGYLELRGDGEVRICDSAV